MSIQKKLEEIETFIESIQKNVRWVNQELVKQELRVDVRDRQSVITDENSNMSEEESEQMKINKLIYDARKKRAVSRFR